MKRRLDFDPEERNYGPASASVRNILRAWAEVSWFDGQRNPLRAAMRFAEHHARARLHLPGPDAFLPTFEARLARGGWEKFSELCAQVRRGGAWDWKYGPLKKLSLQHSRAAGWSPEEILPPATEPPSPPRPGDLFFRVGDSVVWTGLGLKLETEAPLRQDQLELANWYIGYADMDALFAIEWQLAERSNDTSTNPFLPLLDCYAAGVLPFGLGPEEFVLFALDSGN